MKRVVMGFVLGIAGILAFANTAAACMQTCEFISPTCRSCVDVDWYTGATCQNTSGSCGCRYTNYCDAAAFEQSIGVKPVEEAATCSALPTDTAMSAELVSAAE
jgi:hypothetical protein